MDFKTDAERIAYNKQRNCSVNEAENSSEIKTVISDDREVTETLSKFLVNIVPQF